MVETWNSANGFIFFGRGGEVAGSRVADQHTSVAALHLLQSCLVYVNTLMLQRVLAEPAWRVRMTEADMRGLTPLVWGHVSPYGAFDLDMWSTARSRDQASRMSRSLQKAHFVKNVLSLSVEPARGCGDAGFAAVYQGEM